MDIATRVAKLSHARRLQVGAVIVKDNNILSYGYNGMPAGMTNECEEQIYEEGNSYPAYKTKPEVIHAEANAIAKIARQGGNGQDAIMFVTHSPCIECAKLIIQAGIKTVYWKLEYRDTTGVGLLNTAGITTWKE